MRPPPAATPPVVIDLVSPSSAGETAPATTPPALDTVQLALSYSATVPLERQGRSTTEPIVVPYDAKLPLTDGQVLLLDEHFKAQTPTTPEIDAALEKAQSSNQHAYARWKKQYKDLPGFQVNKVDAVDDLYAASSKLQTEPVALAYLLRALPYLQIFFATVADSVLVTLGRSLITLGRAQMLRRLQGSDVPVELQQVCREWGAAIDHSDQPEARWVLAQEANRWSKIGRYRPYGIPFRVMPDIAVASWFRIVACILADTDALPPRFRHVPLAQQCDALLIWLVLPAHRADVRIVADALERRVWSAAAALLPDDLLVPEHTTVDDEAQASATTARH